MNVDHCPCRDCGDHRGQECGAPVPLVDTRCARCVRNLAALQAGERLRYLAEWLRG